MGGEQHWVGWGGEVTGARTGRQEDPKRAQAAASPRVLCTAHIVPVNVKQPVVLQNIFSGAIFSGRIEGGSKGGRGR